MEARYSRCHFGGTAPDWPANRSAPGSLTTGQVTRWARGCEGHACRGQCRLHGRKTNPYVHLPECCFERWAGLDCPSLEIIRHCEKKREASPGYQEKIGRASRATASSWHGFNVTPPKTFVAVCLLESIRNSPDLLWGENHAPRINCRLGNGISWVTATGDGFHPFADRPPRGQN